MSLINSQEDVVVELIITSVKLDHLVLVFSQKMRPCDQIAMVHGRTKSISFVLSARIGHVLFEFNPNGTF
jgi:hypothetical protein